MEMPRSPQRINKSHGGVRGDDLDRRSSQFEGFFGRLFRTLPAATWSQEALKKLVLGFDTTPDADGNSVHVTGMSADPETEDSREVVTPIRKLPRAPIEDQPTRLHDAEEDGLIDAGYTYLGQFIDHDLTFDPASSLQKRNDVDALVDYRTPRFDLDCIYGRGPDDQPYMYLSDGVRFQIGRTLFEGPGGAAISNDLPRHSWTEVTEHGRVDFHRALIGDKRNDENVIVCQLHVLFLKFHNRMVDDHVEEFPGSEKDPVKLFADVQRKVRWHYQYVVLHDYLKKIVKKSVIQSILPYLESKKSIYEDTPRLRFYHPKNEAFMPIEFAAAAFRFGHSMVRPIYRLNKNLKGGNDPDLTDPNEIIRGIDGRHFIFAGLPFRGLNGFQEFPQSWGIDWDLFFDLTGNKGGRTGANRTQPAYKIDTSLVNPLAFLPEFSDTDAEPPLDDVTKLHGKPRPKGAIANLALRNLLRGMSMSLPSGQDVARAMGLIPIDDENLKVGKAEDKVKYSELPVITDFCEEFKSNAPLWYYILAEAQHEWFEGPDMPADKSTIRLGEVGSRIVAETFIGMLLADGHSILRQAPEWHPKIGKGEFFDMPDFVNYALGK